MQPRKFEQIWKLPLCDITKVLAYAALAYTTDRIASIVITYATNRIDNIINT